MSHANAGLPDCEAQELWDRVSQMSDSIGNTLDDIYRLTVCGEQTRTELREAGDLLERAVTILERTSVREQRFVTERARLLGDDPGGRPPCIVGGKKVQP